ncbi:MAG TPA: MFS transporter [Oligoflexia bacterium]|nr:MFS transporter [Oligoflexia bacterium]HMP48888.1 MFS transporter [Oligoflexia bacterium]
MKNIKALHYFSFLNSFRPHWPISVIYFQEITSSYATVMTIYSIVFLSQAFLEIPAGVYSDGIGRRRTMIIGSIFAFLYISCYAVGINFWVLAIGALLEGLARAFFSGTDSAMLYESLPVEDRGTQFQHYLGRINSMSQLALCLSAALCSFLSIYSLKLVLWVSVIPQLLSIVSTLVLYDVEEIKEDQQSLLQILKEAYSQFKINAKLRLLALVETLEFGIGESVFYFQAAFFNLLVPTWALGLARCLNHLAGFIGFWFAGGLINRFGARNTLIRGTGLNFFVKMVSVVFASFLSPFMMGISNIIYGPCSAARGTLLHLEFSDYQRATMGSMVSLSGSILFACVSTFLGFIADIFSPKMAMIVGLSSNLVIIVLYKFIFNDVKGNLMNETHIS